MSRLVRRIAIAVTLVLSAAPVAMARCGDDPGDAAAMAAAREQIETDCYCAGAATHRTYGACARGVAHDREVNGLPSPECVRDVNRCASRSTCGRPGAVTCCTFKHGVQRCRVRRDAAHCYDGGGTVGACPSCCDACGGSCPPPPAACGHRTGGACLGECPPATPICANVGGDCQCVAGSAPCGPVGSFECDGTCPPGEACLPGGLGTCGCLPSTSELCAESRYPACGLKACPDGKTCIAIPISEFETICACPPVICTGGGAFPTCGGSCPAGSSCRAVTLGPVSGCVCLPPTP